MLHHGLLLLELSELSLHVFILVFLCADLRLQVLEVSDDQRVYNLDVLIVEGLQVVVHHRDVLSQAFNFLFVFT